MKKMVNLKILRSSILLFLTPTYPTAVLSGLRIAALFNKLEFYKKRLLVFNTWFSFFTDQHNESSAQGITS